jgi:hypothetical protein
VARGSHILLKLRTAIGFVFGIVALLIGAIALLTYWHVYNVRNRRP